MTSNSYGSNSSGEDDETHHYDPQHIKNSHLRHNKTNLRKKLPSIDQYNTELQFRPNVPTRIILKLEKLIGTSIVRPEDRRFMRNLRQKLEAGEKSILKNRLIERKNEEIARCKKLIIEGKLKVSEEEERKIIHNDPVIRVNRIMDRLDKIDEDLKHNKDLNLKRIIPMEPFEDEEETGVIFSWHPNHYLKMRNGGTLPPLNLKAKKSVSRLKLTRSGSRKELRHKDDDLIYLKKPRQGSFHRKSLFKSNRSTSIKNLSRKSKVSVISLVENKDGVKRAGIESKEDAKIFRKKAVEVDEKYEDLPHKSNDIETLDEIKEFYNEDLEKAKKRFGIIDENLEELWAKYQSPLLKRVFESKEDLFDTSHKTLDVYRRQKYATDNFINKIHKKL